MQVSKDTRIAAVKNARFAGKRKISLPVSTRNQRINQVSLPVLYPSQFIGTALSTNTVILTITRGKYDEEKCITKARS